MGEVQLKRRVKPQSQETEQQQTGAAIDGIFRQVVGSINAAVESGSGERTEMVPTTPYYTRNERREEAGRIIDDLLFLGGRQGDEIADRMREGLKNRLLSFFQGPDARAEVMHALDAMEMIMREGTVELARKLDPGDAAKLSSELRALNVEMWNMKNLDQRLETLETTGLDPVNNTQYGKKKAAEIAKGIRRRFLDFFGERGHQLLQRIESLSFSGVDSKTGKKLSKNEAEEKASALRKELNAFIQGVRLKLMDRIEAIEVHQRDPGHRVELEGVQAEKMRDKIISELLAAVDKTLEGSDYMPHPVPASSPRLDWTLDENRVVLLFALKDYLKLINSGNYGETEKEAIKKLTAEVKANFLGGIKGGALTAEEWYNSIITRSVPGAITGREEKRSFMDFMGEALREYDKYAQENGGQRVLSEKRGMLVPRDEFVSLLVALCVTNARGDLRASEEVLLLVRRGVMEMGAERPGSAFTAQR